MAFRFRNTIRIAPGIRLNLGKKGVSLSAGVRGASITAGKNGVYGNVGLPGTGLSYRTRLDKSPAHRRRVEQEEARQYRAQRQQEMQQHNPDLSDVRLSLSDKGLLILHDLSGQPLEPKLRQRLLSDFKADIQEWLDVQVERINGDMDLLLNPHLDMPSSDNPPPEYPAQPFTELQPVKPQLTALQIQPEQPQQLKINWIDRLVPGRKQRLTEAWQQAEDQWREDIQRWEQEKSALEQQHAAIISNYELELTRWRTLKTAHDAQQHEDANNFLQRLKTDPEVMAATLQAELEALDWPRETLIDFELDDTGQLLKLDVDLPEIEDFPQQEARLGARELRLVLKKKSQSQLRQEYARHIHGVLLRIIGTAFSTLNVQQLSISGYSQRLNPATGYVEDEYLLSAKVARSTFEQINFNNLEDVDPILALDRFELTRDMSNSFILRCIKPNSEE